MTQNIFPLFSEALWLRINSCYSMLFSNLKQKGTALLVVESLADACIPCILRHSIYISMYIHFLFTFCICISGARGVNVIVVGNEHGEPSSNPGLDWLHFT